MNKLKNIYHKVHNLIDRTPLWLIKGLCVLFIFLIFAQLYHWFFSIYTIQSPVVIEIRPPVVEKFISPISEDTSTVITPQQEKPIDATNSAELTPTPTPKEKAQKLDLIGTVDAAEMIPTKYRYEDKVHLFSQEQLGVLNKVLDRLGVEGARVVFKEATFNHLAVNPESGACGLFQAYPCSKLPCELEDIDCQLDWGEQYITGRYGSPAQAYKFHLENNWY